MKSLQQKIDESTINESVLGGAAAVIAGIIGYKMLKALLNGLSVKILNGVAKKDSKKLDAIQSEMTEILKKYPEAYENMKYTYDHILRGKGGKRNSICLAESGAFLEKDIKDFDETDKKRFKELFSQVQEIQDGVLKYYSDWDLEDLK